MHVGSPRFASRVTRLVTALGLVAGALVLTAPAASATSVNEVSTGAVTACVLTSAGGVKCWGYNGQGELGDGTTHDRTAPVDVSGLTSGDVVDVQAAWDHSCALKTNGNVKCWGHNGDGELGDGTKQRSLTPTSVNLAGDATQISLGFDSGCALLASTEVQCWGYNGNGQLGDGSRTTRKNPVYVEASPTNATHLTGVADISAGWDHTCAHMAGGTVKCWGDNRFGEIGDGSKTDRLKPVNVTVSGANLSGVTAVAAGYNQTCALITGGSVKCWGGNGKGQLGDGTKKDRVHPVAVKNLTGVASISAGYNHTCAVAGGAAKCWGANASGELGDGSTKNRLQPVGVYGSGSGVAEISAGGWKGAGLTCLSTTTGAVKCFGANHGVSGLEPVSSNGGQIGDGTKIDRHIPITVRTLLGSSPTAYQPDALISKSSSGPFAGNNVYNAKGKNQSKSLSVKPGKTVKFFVKVQNDSTAKDSFFLLGTGPGKGFGVKYSIGGKSIKVPVVDGTYWLTLKPGASKTVQVAVTAGSGLSSSAKRTFKVLVRSAGNSAKVDAVKATVKV